MRFDHPTAHQTGALRALWRQAFGDTEEFLDQFFSTGFSPRHCRCAMENGQLAAALYWFDCEFDGRKLAYLYAIATDAVFQNRGVCRALMADTHTLLKAHGYSGTLLVPGAASLGAFYGSRGYRWATGLREFFCTAAPEPVSVQSIDADEYARLRREVLPAGSVLQEGRSLAFLGTQALFYAGPRLLLAARREEDTLFGLELLGDPAAGPGLVRALGSTRGHFRTPGRDRSFAMYRPLDSAPPPAYFAFAFD